MMRRAFIFFLLILATPFCAQADEPGINYGPWRMTPQLTIAETFDDNTQRRAENPTPDWVTSVSPALAATRQGKRSEINLRLDTTVQIYHRGTRANIFDYSTLARWQYELAAQTFIRAEGAHTQRQLGENAQDDTNRPRRLTLVEDRAEINLVRALGVLQAHLSSFISRAKLDAPLSRVVSWGARDRWIQAGEIAYQPHAQARFYLRGTHMVSDEETDLHGTRRLVRPEVRLGWRQQMFDRLNWDVQAGWTTQNSDAQNMTRAARGIGRLDVAWTVRPDFQVRGIFDRDLMDTTEENTAGAWRNRQRLETQYTFDRDNLLSLWGERGTVDYILLQVTPSRSAITRRVGATVQHRLNSRAVVESEFEHRHRDDTRANADYDAHVARIAVSLAW